MQQERERHSSNLLQANTDIESTQDILEATIEAGSILQTVASHVQRCWYESLGKIVTKCLAAVFPDPYEFKLVFEQLANRTQVQFLLVRDLETHDPLTETGGGVVDIASFALRVAAIMLQVQGQRQLLIIDEPFRFVSEGYRGQVSMLLERLAEEFQVQLIIVTHMKELEVGNVIRIS